MELTIEIASLTNLHEWLCRVSAHLAQSLQAYHLLLEAAALLINCCSLLTFSWVPSNTVCHGYLSTQCVIGANIGACQWLTLFFARDCDV